MFLDVVSRAMGLTDAGGMEACPSEFACVFTAFRKGQQISLGSPRQKFSLQSVMNVLNFVVRGVQHEG